ncbi:hypothetical protein CR513_09897, partial [Mucuna pruriens]
MTFRIEKHIPTPENLEDNKKRKNIKGVVEESSQQKKPKKDEKLTCYFCKKSGHMKKQCSKYNYLYLIHENSQSLDVFKSFKAEIKLQLGKKIKAIKSDRGEYGIVSQYTMPRKSSINEITQVVEDNVQTLFLTLFENKTMMKFPLKHLLRRSIRERRHAIPDDCIVFLQEHEDDLGLTEYDPINFCQAMQSSNSTKSINVMKDEMKSMQDNDVLDLVELPEDNERSLSRYPKVSQENYISKVLNRFDMKDSKPGNTLIAKGDKFSLKQCPNNDLERNDMQKISYTSAVGSLICNGFIVNV